MNNKGKFNWLMGLFILSLLTPLIASGIAEQWHMFWLFAIFYILFGIMELLSIKSKGVTISERVGNLHREEPWKFWIIQGSWVIMCAGLFIHFLMM